MELLGAQTRLLTRHFFNRFLYNDLLSPNGESQANLALVLAGLAVPGLWLSLGLVFSYSSPFIAPSERLLLALHHKYQFIAVSMIVMALAATLQWEALGLDGRDLANLGPLPVAPGALLQAKVLALLMLFSAFAVALNAIPSLAFPAAYLSLVPIGLARAIWLSLVHALVTLAAAAFGFACVLAGRSLILALAGPRLFRRISTVVQFLLVLALVTLFFLIPAGASRVLPALEQPSVAARISPPLWFLGAYEGLTAPGLLGDPKLLAHTRWNLWVQTRNRLSPDSPVLDEILFRPEDEARARYEALLPALGRLAREAIAWSAAVLGLAALLYVAAHRRHASRLREALVMDGRRAAGVRGLVSRLAGAVIVRHPVARAGFFFTLQALARSAKHRLYLAGSLALGLALSSATAASSLHQLAEGGGDVPGPLLAVQLTLIFFVAGGFRAVMDVPVELRSNWAFQACWTGDRRHYLAGVRRAAFTGLLLPLVVVMAPVHIAAWGWTRGAWHASVGTLVALILVEVVVLGYRKLPFTCSYVAKGTFKFYWPGYVAAFLVVTSGVAALERIAFRHEGGALTLAVALVLLLAALQLYRAWRVRRQAAVLFEEEPDLAAIPLGLG